MHDVDGFELGGRKDEAGLFEGFSDHTACGGLAVLDVACDEAPLAIAVVRILAQEKKDPVLMPYNEIAAYGRAFSCG